jgi:hypothetical protein
MGNEVNKVLIAGTTYTKDFQEKPEFIKGWQSVLKKNHGPDSKAYCGCFGKGEKRLIIRYYKESDTYRLSKYPTSGEDHDNECQYYAPNPEKSGLQCYITGVLKELDHGNIGITLGIGLKAKEPSETTSANPSMHGTSTNKQTAISLLGLLHWLWQDAALNYWRKGFEGKRSWGTVRDRLNPAVEKLRSGRRKMSDYVIIAGRDNQNQIEKAMAENNRLIVIAPITSQNDYKILCEKFYGLPYLNLKNGTWDARINKYPRESEWLLQDEAGRKGHVVLIAHTEPPQEVVTSNETQGIKAFKDRKHKAVVVNYALMRVTDSWIPISSSYEYELADKLVEQGRTFEKPLRFDAEADTFFPDFILKDVGATDYLMEVFGMSTSSYILQKQRKTEWYDKKYGEDGWWNWDATATKQIPDLPPARKY